MKRKIKKMETQKLRLTTGGHAERALQQLVLLEHLLLLGAGLARARALARREHGPAHLALARGPGELALAGELEAGPLGPGAGYRVARQGAVPLHAVELGTLKTPHRVVRNWTCYTPNTPHGTLNTPHRVVRIWTCYTLKTPHRVVRNWTCYTLNTLHRVVRNWTCYTLNTPRGTLKTLHRVVRNWTCNIP